MNSLNEIQHAPHQVSPGLSQASKASECISTGLFSNPCGEKKDGHPSKRNPELITNMMLATPPTVADLADLEGFPAGQLDPVVE